MSTDLFDQYATLDPAEMPEALPDWTSTAPVLLAEIDERTHPMQTKHRPNTSTEPKRRWTGVLVAAAAFVVVLILGVSVVMLSSGGDPLDAVAPVTTTTAATVTTAAPPAAVVVPEVWDPILSTTVAKAAPPAATCPAGTNPNAPGPADQERPEPGWVSNQAAAFDRHAGRIVYVDVAGETWTFDVCTSTWQKMNPTGAPVAAEDLYRLDGDSSYALGELVYDVDSDLSIAFGSWNLAIYDANTNTWTRKNYPAALERDGNDAYNPGGALYDPVSGLVITGNNGDISVYDVDTDQWTSLGPVEEEGEEEGAYRFLVGYSAANDQLIFQGGEGGNNGNPNHSGVIANVRDGGVTTLPRPGPNGTGVFGWFAYATDTDTAFVGTAGGQVCRFNPVTFDWDTCFTPPSGFGSPSMIYSVKSARVGDPINNRLILMHGNHGPWSAPGTTEVWAIDLESGEWTQLLAPSSP